MARIKINELGNIEVTGSDFNREIRLEENALWFDAPFIATDEIQFNEITNIPSESIENNSTVNTIALNDTIPVKTVQSQTVDSALLNNSVNIVNTVKDYSGKNKTSFFGISGSNFSPEKVLEANAQRFNYPDNGQLSTNGAVLFEMHEFWPEIGYTVTPNSGSEYTGSGYFSNVGGLTAFEYDAVNAKKQKPYWWSSDNDVDYVKDKNLSSETAIELGGAYFASPNVRLKRNYIPNIFKIGFLHHSIFQTAGYPLEYTEISGGIKPPKLADSVIADSKTELNADATQTEDLNSVYKDFIFDSFQVGDPVKITYGLWEGSVGYDVNNTPFDLLWGFAGSWQSPAFKTKGISTAGTAFDFTGNIFNSSLKHNFPFYENPEFKFEAAKYFAEWTFNTSFADQNPLAPTFNSQFDTEGIGNDAAKKYYRYARYYWTNGATGWVQGATDPSIVDVDNFDDYGSEPAYKLNTTGKTRISEQIPVSTLGDYRNITDLKKYNTLRRIDTRDII